METPKWYVLIISQPLYFRCYISCSFNLFSCFHWCMLLFTIRLRTSDFFLIKFASLKTPKPNNFLQNWRKFKPKVVYRGLQKHGNRRKMKNKNTPQKDKTKKSKSQLKYSTQSKSVSSPASETGQSPNKWSQDTTKSLDCFFQCFNMMLWQEIPSGFLVLFSAN